jgi:hypothetical protein
MTRVGPQRHRKYIYIYTHEYIYIYSHIRAHKYLVCSGSNSDIREIQTTLNVPEEKDSVLRSVCTKRITDTLGPQADACSIFKHKPQLNSVQ